MSVYEGIPIEEPGRAGPGWARLGREIVPVRACVGVRCPHFVKSDVQRVLWVPDMRWHSACPD